MEPKDVKVAMIHEDGPYGVGVAAADEAYARKPACRSCTRKAIPPPHLISPCW